MLKLTVAESAALAPILLGVVVGWVCASAWIMWRQEKDIAALSAHRRRLEWEIGKLWDALEPAADADAPTGPIPRQQPDNPATDVAHPADTWARKATLLARYSHPGQHRR